MEEFKSYISEEKIISCLVKFRARRAKENNKKYIIQKISSHPIHSEPLAVEEELGKLLPSRRKWKKLNKTSRVKNRFPLNSVKKNKLILENTIKYYQSHGTAEPFIQNLHKFVSDVQNTCRDKTYKFQKPEIYPKLKNKKDLSNKACRPISNYKLKDKIIIGLTNKYFTDLFDKYFEDCSFAFRSLQLREDGRHSYLNHHDAFEVIKKYRERFKGKDLYVAECDIQKFYDSVNHTQIKKVFKRLIKKVKKEQPQHYDADAEALFYKYLDSYKFNKDVWPLNNRKKSSFFEDHKIKDGFFKWVEDELKAIKHYRSFNNAKIGVPQGGALSGLITNIVLDYVDREVLKNADDDLLYVRYCDDMLIIHPKKKVCSKIFKIYNEALKKLKLIPHPLIPNNRVEKGDKFWKLKTKVPYLWTIDLNKGKQWIGFVGYEIHCDGYVRVRKNSLEKEIQKQRDVVKRALNAIEGGHNKVSKRVIVESVVSTLIGMSVGRVELWKYKDYPSELCWVSGFRLIEKNKYSKIQLKRLDRSRNNLIKKFQNRLRKMPLRDSQSNKETSNKQIVYYGKPFSYYYNLIEKNN